MMEWENDRMTEVHARNKSNRTNERAKRQPYKWSRELTIEWTKEQIKEWTEEITKETTEESSSKRGKWSDDRKPNKERMNNSDRAMDDDVKVGFNLQIWSRKVNWIKEDDTGMNDKKEGISMMCFSLLLVSWCSGSGGGCTHTTTTSDKPMNFSDLIQMNHNEITNTNIINMQPFDVQNPSSLVALK